MYLGISPPLNLFNITGFVSPWYRIVSPWCIYGFLLHWKTFSHLIHICLPLISLPLNLFHVTGVFSPCYRFVSPWYSIVSPWCILGISTSLNNFSCLSHLIQMSPWITFLVSDGFVSLVRVVHYASERMSWSGLSWHNRLIFSTVAGPSENGKNN